MDIRKSEAASNIALVIVVLLALVSLAAGVHDALQAGRSQDFQWSGAHMLIQHIDPWAEELRGDPHHYITLAQHPNYLALLYLLLAPLAKLPMRSAALIWMLLNLLFIGISCVCASRFYRLNGRMGLLLAALTLMATPIRLSVGNGQTALFVLVILSASLLTHRLNKGRAVLAGFSYVKFNFGPAVFIYLGFRAGLAAMLLSLVPAAVAILLTWLWLGNPHGLHGLLLLVREPLDATARGYFPRGADMNLMDVLELPFRGSAASAFVQDLLALAIAVSLTCLIFWRTRPYSDEVNLALLGLLAFAFYRHHTYDATTLLFPLAFMLPRSRERMAKVGLVALGFVLYFQRGIDAISRNIPYMFVVDFVALLVVLGALWKLRGEGQSGTGAHTKHHPSNASADVVEG